MTCALDATTADFPNTWKFMWQSRARVASRRSWTVWSPPNVPLRTLPSALSNSLRSRLLLFSSSRTISGSKISPVPWSFNVSHDIHVPHKQGIGQIQVCKCMVRAVPLWLGWACCFGMLSPCLFGWLNCRFGFVNSGGPQCNCQDKCDAQILWNTLFKKMFVFAKFYVWTTAVLVWVHDIRGRNLKRKVYSPVISNGYWKFEWPKPKWSWPKE